MRTVDSLAHITPESFNVVLTLNSLVLRTGILSLMLLAAAGCSSDSADVSPGTINTRTTVRQTEPDTRPIDVRIAEIEELGTAGRFEDAPRVIAVIDDPSPAVRNAAITSIERIMGYGVPVNPYWSQDKLRAAKADIERMRALAEEVGVEHFVDTVPALIDRMEDASPDVRRQAYLDIKRTTGIGYGFKPNGTPEQRARVVAAYRELWTHWNRDGSRALDLLRDPDLRAEHKQSRVEEMTSAE